MKIEDYLKNESVATSTLNSTDTFTVLRDNLLKNISYSDLLSLVASAVAASNVNEGFLKDIISRDSTWKLDIRGNQYTSIFPCFTSMGISGSESGTGILKLGYFKPKNTLHFLVFGGGGTNGSSKLLRFVDASSDTVLHTLTLDQITGNTNSDLPLHKTIDTSLINGIRCYLQFEDNDSGSSWSWWGFVMNSFFVE